jgi:hypothetical protein
MHVRIHVIDDFLASIYCHSQSGDDNPGDLIQRVVKGFAELHAFPKTKADLDLTPVDWVSRAIVAISMQNSSASLGLNFHLTNSAHVTVAELAATMQHCGLQMKQMEYVEWRQLLRDSPKCSLFPLMGLFAGSDFPLSGHFVTANTISHFGSPLRVGDATIRAHLKHLGLIQ